MRALLLLVFLCAPAMGHQFTPTYPEVFPSHLPGISKVTMELFNSRNDISYYTIGVFTTNWQRVPFATSDKVLKIEYLGRKTIDIYIRNTDLSKAVYICSKSRTLVGQKQVAIVSSKICSKLK
jgi:hypothetical protein